MLRRIKQELAEGRNLITFTTLRVGEQVLGVVMPLMVAKLFSSELFASYSLARMVIFFVAALTISAAQRPFIVYANQEREKTGKINRSFSTQCIFVVVSLWLYLIVVLLFAGPIKSFAKISTADLVFVSLAFVGFAAKVFICNLFMALGQRTKNALAGLTYEAAAVFFIVFFYTVDRINLHSVFLVYFLSSVFLFIIFVKKIDFSLLHPFELDLIHFKGMLAFTNWVMLGATAGYFVNWGDNLVLRFFVPMQQIGIYNFSYLIFKGLMLLIVALQQYFLPFISQHIDNKEKLHNYLYVKRPKVMALGLLVLVGAFFLLPYILNPIYGSVYFKWDVVLRILLIATAVRLYVIFYYPLFDALKKYRYITLAVVVQITVNIVLDLVFVPYIGILGAAVATVIAYFCSAILMEVYYRLHIRGLVVYDKRNNTGV